MKVLREAQMMLNCPAFVDNGYDYTVVTWAYLLLESPKPPITVLHFCK